jgi:prophage antirepressor-like protein
MQAIELAKHIFQNKEIRIYGTPKRPLFIAADIGAVLEMGNVRSTVAKFAAYKKDTVHTMDAIGRQHDMLALTEAGLYSLVLKSKMTVAKEFEQWLLETVLPTIRETGQFIVKPLESTSEENNTIPHVQYNLPLSDDERSIISQHQIEEDCIAHVV